MLFLGTLRPADYLRINFLDGTICHHRLHSGGKLNKKSPASFCAFKEPLPSFLKDYKVQCLRCFASSEWWCRLGQ